jgi:hypothetical protein
MEDDMAPTAEQAWITARLQATDAARIEGRISPEVAAIRSAQIRGEITDDQAEERIDALSHRADPDEVV